MILWWQTSGFWPMGMKWNMVEKMEEDSELSQWPNNTEKEKLGGCFGEEWLKVLVLVCSHQFALWVLVCSSGLWSGAPRDSWGCCRYGPLFAFSSLHLKSIHAFPRCTTFPENSKTLKTLKIKDLKIKTLKIKTLKFAT